MPDQFDNGNQYANQPQYDNAPQPQHTTPPQYGDAPQSQYTTTPQYASEPQTTNVFAIASLVLGILSIILAYFYAPVGLVLGIIGIVLGAKARKEAPSGIATGGFVCSIIGTVICGALLLCVICTVGLLGVAVSSMDPDELSDIVEVSVDAANFFRLV